MQKMLKVSCCCSACYYLLWVLSFTRLCCDKHCATIATAFVPRLLVDRVHLLRHATTSSSSARLRGAQGTAGAALLFAALPSPSFSSFTNSEEDDEEEDDDETSDRKKQSEEAKQVMQSVVEEEEGGHHDYTILAVPEETTTAVSFSETTRNGASLSQEAAANESFNGESTMTTAASDDIASYNNENARKENTETNETSDEDRRRHGVQRRDVVHDTDTRQPLEATNASSSIQGEENRIHDDAAYFKSGSSEQSVNDLEQAGASVGTSASATAGGGFATPFFASVTNNGEIPRLEDTAISHGDNSNADVQQQHQNGEEFEEKDFAKLGSAGRDGSEHSTASSLYGDGSSQVEKNCLLSMDRSDVNGDAKADADKERQFEEYKAADMEHLRQNANEAKKRSTEAEARVAAIQSRADELQEELDFAESELSQYLTIKEEESDSIIARVDELQDLIEMKDARKRQAEETLEAAAKESRDKLLKEIEAGKYALRQAKEELNVEKETFAQIQTRLEATEKQSKAERTAFEQDEEELLAKIRDQKSKLADAETRIQEERDQFEEERTNLGRKLQDRITRLAETNARIQLETSLFSMNQIEVRQNIASVKSKLEKTERHLQDHQELSAKETRELENLAEILRQELREATDKLESQKQMSQQTKEELEMKLVFEKVKAKNLSDELKNQQQLHLQEVNALESTSSENRAKLKEAKALLESSLARFSEEKSTLEDQIAESERIRKVRAKQIKQRYRDVREEMTERWQRERRVARREQSKLVQGYSTQLSELQGTVPRLEREVSEACKLAEDLRVRASEAALEKAAILEEGRSAEMRYIQMKQERNVAISALETEIDYLRDDITERDEKLASYKSSLRVLFGLSMKLARKRIKATRNRLLSSIRRPEKPTMRSTRSSIEPSTKRLPIDGGNDANR